jgi:hypothetical protein
LSAVELGRLPAQLRAGDIVPGELSTFSSFAPHPTSENPN